MNYLKYSNYLMASIKAKLAKDYSQVFTEENTSYTLPASKGTVTIAFNDLNSFIVNSSDGFFETYQILPAFGEMATYCSFKKDDDNLRIIHQRVLKSNDDRLVIISSAAQINNLEILAIDDNFSWPCSIIKTTYEETLATLYHCCSFNLDKEITGIIQDGVAYTDLLDTMLNEQEKVIEVIKADTRR